MEGQETQNDLGALVEEIKALREEIATLKADHEELSRVVKEDIIAPIENDYNQKKYDEALGIWKDKFGERLGAYSDRLKATDGDDFDIIKASYDSWNDTEDIDAEEWVEALCQSIDEQLEPIARAFGVPKEDLNANIVVEDGKVADVQADYEPEETSEETPAEEDVEIDDTDEEPELSEEEQFQKELDEAYERQRRM